MHKNRIDTSGRSWNQLSNVQHPNMWVDSQSACLFIYRVSHNTLDTLFLPISRTSEQLEYKFYIFSNCPFIYKFKLPVILFLGLL